MNSYPENATERSSEDRAAAALMVVMALVFAGYFALRVVMPDLPLQIHQTLASLPDNRGPSMKPVIATAASLLMLASAPTPANEGAQTISVTRAGSQASNKGPAQYFTGSVRVDPLFPVVAPSRVSAASVTFEPGARAAWHTHPVGQILIVTAGLGRVQQWGGPVHEIRPGDVVRIPPGVKHWHGAAPATAMTHIAINETVDGRNVDWLEKVSDEQYGR